MSKSIIVSSIMGKLQFVFLGSGWKKDDIWIHLERAVWRYSLEMKSDRVKHRSFWSCLGVRTLTPAAHGIARRSDCGLPS